MKTLFLPSSLSPPSRTPTPPPLPKPSFFLRPLFRIVASTASRPP